MIRPFLERRPIGAPGRPTGARDGSGPRAVWSHHSEGRKFVPCCGVRNSSGAAFRETSSRRRTDQARSIVAPMKDLECPAAPPNEIWSLRDQEVWLPPRKDWPERVYALDEFRGYPDLLNSTEELLDRQVLGGRGAHPAIVAEGTALTYAQLLRLANRFGNALRRLGVVEGDRIVLRSLNEPPALIANFGALRLGAVVVPTSPLLSEDELAHIANDCRAVCLVVGRYLLPAALKAKQACPGVRHVVAFGGRPEEARAHGFLSYEELVADEDCELEPVRRPRQAVWRARLRRTTGRPAARPRRPRPRGTA